MKNHWIVPAKAEIFNNQLKAWLAELPPTTKNPNNPNKEVNPTAYIGTPYLVMEKIFGAEPLVPMEYKTLEPTIKSEFAAEITAVRTIALKILGNTLTPDLWNAITNGDEAISLVVEFNLGSLYGTNKPIKKMDPM